MLTQVWFFSSSHGSIANSPVNYVLRGGELFNMVLLVPDDIPEESLASTIEGNVEEMCALFKDWDPRYILYFPSIAGIY